MADTPPPLGEQERLRILRELCILDTPDDPALDRVCELAAALFEVPIVLVSLVDEHRQWFKARVGLGARQTPRGQAFCAHALDRTDALVVPDAACDPRFAANPLVTSAPHIRFYAGWPLRTAEGAVLGTLCLIDRVPRHDFGAPAQALLEKLAALVLTRIHTLRSFGHSDRLTGLPNRLRFAEEVLHRSRNAGMRPGALALLAIDVCGTSYFGNMSRALGYAYGEQYLLRAQARLAAALPPGTPLYRIDTTCFALFHDVARHGAADARAAELAAAFAEAVTHAGIPHSARPCITHLPLAADVDADDLVRRLITALGCIRERGEIVGDYEEGWDVAQRRSFQILSGLPQALLAADQLSLHYQPRVDLASGRCLGAEALLRWRHPLLGEVPPSEFVALAENTELMRELTRWVLEQAAAQMRRWRDAGRNLVLSVNVSPVDLDHPGFARRVAEALARHDVPGAALELEFTENALLRSPQRLQANLEILRALGVGVAIDDFGTGRNNLNTLRALAGAALKIDQSFLRAIGEDTTNRTIVPALLKLGRDLGHRTVAEGVETGEALELMRAWGCDEAQGYWIARPLPVAGFEAWLDARRDMQPSTSALSPAPAAAPDCPSPSPRQAHPA
ncbi:EAL domain-containing protein [Coralloluteibacterium stylophorae]|uniref:EAL domain-containing protein n=1 Tax=Coralloluteibacterium stylophorae TaxID=1776034 RepID=A0A8J7VRI2_9GAMM|nr:sensor domain-containing phosphodiesterase [Coralloluteibacterium stylophorae]MBS7457317.1 EAL domain-containing protein [Coralloluteibacterium stylophorae]